MPRKEFEAITRLDPSDVNSFLMDQSVMTFAGTAARGSAIPTPVEGMYAHLQDTDSLEFYNGSAWVSPFGTTLVSTSTFTTVSTVSFNNVFTSQYRNYKIVFRANQSIPGASIAFKLRVGGVDSSNIYSYAYGLLAGSFTQQGRNSAGTAGEMIVSSDGAFGIKFGEITVFAPQLAVSTTLTTLGGTSVGIMTFAAGDTSATTQFDGFTFYVTSGSFTGNIEVYGLRK